MKVIGAIFITLFAIFVLATGVIFESAVSSGEKVSYSPPSANGSEKSAKEIIFPDRNYLLPFEKIKEPVRKSGAQDVDITAKAVLVIDEEGGKVLYDKAADDKLAIASLTKLATAVTVLELADGAISGGKSGVKNYDLSRNVEISKAAVDEEGDSGHLIVGEKIKASDLLTIMLVASSNDAAHALAEDAADFEGYPGGVDDFVELMNEVALKEGLSNTHFSNSTGIDRENQYSTAKDIVKMAKVFLKRYPKIFTATKYDKIDIKSEDGKNDHYLQNTNKLLGQMQGIKAGKTGYTEMAGESLLLAVRNPADNSGIIAVVIGADDRFLEMKKMVDWIWKTYEWK